ncbi:MAG TPA: proton-conducting transporter membrane subunit, partial [Casimicrobiaceae bacterium]|nr:proton-conducting transporter membrane subunit [Casimicrobiaceae bacterium]
MEAQSLLLVFAVLCGVGMLLAGTFVPERQGSLLAWIGAAAGIVLVLAGGRILTGGAAFVQTLWSVPGVTVLTLTCDRLSAMFIAVTGLVLAPASIFAGRDLDREGRRGGERSFTTLLLALYVSIVLVYLAGDAVTFLLAWELMSILCYLLIVGGRGGENGRAGAGYLLLGLGEAGTVAIMLGFLLLAVSAESLAFPALRSAASAMGGSARWVTFLLSFFGFGVKAGLVPVNSWLPRAYSAAPRAFVPILAGATLNLGLYGILRINVDLMPAVDVDTGLLALAFGSASALLGILYATTDNDLKLMLAHSSIENVGIVVAGFGAGMVFAATGHAALAAIAFIASLYHLANHSLYKTLLFFGVGVVERETGTRDMDQLGGLIRWMPLTALVFLAGTLAIAGLPPLNGFVSEWLTLQTMLRSAELASIEAKIIFALCGAALALTAALAVTCFVKVFAMTFLGMRRLDPERRVAEPTSGALVPMAVLGVLCLALGVLPTYVIGVLDGVVAPMSGARAAEALVPPFFAGAAGHEGL